MTEQDWAFTAPSPATAPTLWRIDLELDPDRPAQWLDILSDEERRRADRFARAQDRHRFVASHVALRKILGGVLASAPSALTFDTNGSGKPKLTGRWRGRLHFNLSHSGAWAVVGVSHEYRIGVDVEAVRPITDHMRIARSHFAPDEVAALSRLSGDRATDAFFACWTRKEAFVKALGLGLARPLNSFSVTLPPDPPALLAIEGDPAAARRWSLQPLDVACGYAGAVAIEASDTRCALRSLKLDWLDRQA